MASLTTPLSSTYSRQTSISDAAEAFYDFSMDVNEREEEVLSDVSEEENLDAEQSQISFVPSQCERVMKKVRLLVLGFFPMAFTIATSVCLYYKSRDFLFNEGENGMATMLSFLIGFCFESAMLSLFRMRNRSDELRLFEVGSICFFTRLSFAVGQAELNSSPFTETYEGLWSAYFASIGATFAAAASEFIRQGIPDESREFKNDWAVYHPKRNCDLNPIFGEPMTVRGFLINNVALEIIAGGGLMIASIFLNDKDGYVCMHAGGFLAGLGVGNGMEFTLTRGVRIFDSRGSTNACKKNLRITNWIAGNLAGIWPAIFALSHNHPSLRFLSGALVGVNNSAKKRSVIEATQRPIADTKQILKSPFFALGAVSVLGVSGWFGYNLYVDPGIAVKLSAASAAVGTLGTFGIKMVVDHLYYRRRYQSVWLTTLKFYTSYSVVWWVLPDQIVEQDIAKIYSRDITANSRAAIATDCIAYVSYGAGWGLTMASESLNPTFIYQSVQSLVTKASQAAQNRTAG